MPSMDRQGTGLPYINNGRAVFITLLINLAFAFAFCYPDGITFKGAMLDAAFSGVSTTAIDMALIYAQMKRMRRMGTLPMEVPENRFMQRLPKNPVALGAVYAVAFAALSLGISWAILSFFGIRQMGFLEWAIYKLVFVTLLSVKIVEYCIFRYIQPDWAGSGACAKSHEPLVRNPLPRFATLKAVYGSVSANLAMGFILGTAFGGVKLVEGSAVLIYPTTTASIPITGLIFGLICGVLVSSGVIKAVDGKILAADPVPEERVAAMPSRQWLPKRRISLTVCVCVATMLVSAVVLRGVMELFNLPVLDFYRYTVLVTAYAAVVNKLIALLLVKRCTSLDYVVYVQRRGRATQMGRVAGV